MSAKRTDDDTNLWAEVIKTITPAKRDDVLFPPEKPVKAKAKSAKQSKPLTKASASSLSRPAIKTTQRQQVRPADLRSSVPFMRAGIDNASAKRLSKGHFDIDETLDLHGKTEIMAHKALSQFVVSAHRRGVRTLLIITGKGDKGQGLLRRKVPEWLKEDPLKPLILALSQANPKDGGGGALYVRLRRQR